MFSTLLKVDNTLIEFAEWVVRQFQLFTKVSREDILTFCMLTIKWLLLAFTVLIPVTTLLDPSLLVVGLLWSLSLYCLFKTYRIHKKLVIKTPKPGTIPQERITRQNVRIFVTLWIPIMMLLLSDWVLKILFSFSFFYLVSLIALAIIITQGIFEYLLCTTSLPPRKKKSFEQEKETFHMSPAFIGNR